MSYDRTILRGELVRDEGLRLKTYRCTAGKLSIGVGRNLDDVGIRPSETAKLGITKASVIAKGVTVAQAMVLLDSDINDCEQALDRNLPWWRKLNPVRQRVILNMTFNMGMATLLKFKNTLLAMKEGRYADAAAGMVKSAWHKQVGNRALRLEAMMQAG